ncbi:MAG TPA: pyruvate dehydrogenase, partial [Balneolaceae bacterium]|nr:pyruvate dehydrogenase [Balneolaceae bacterium]
WAQGIEYRKNVLEEKEYDRAISVILGGDGSVATNGFWSALTIATTQNLPVLFYIEDNGYGISVTSEYQTPGGKISNNLQSFNNLKIYDGDGTDPEEAASLLEESVGYVRDRKGPAMIRLTVPRLNGHSYQDNQAYKDDDFLKKEQERDPLKKLKEFMVPDQITEKTWKNWEKKAKQKIEKATEAALNRPEPDPAQTKKYAFAEEGD